jgi:spore germination protein KC
MVLLNGCVDNKELTEVAIVLAVAIDKDENTGEYIVTSETVVPDALKSTENSDKIPVEYMVDKGKTLIDAVVGTTDFDRAGFYGHTKVIVLGENLAKEGLGPIIDSVARSKDMPRNIPVLIAKGYKGREILGVKYGINKIQAQNMVGIINGIKLTSKITISNFLDIFKKISGKGINPVIGAVEINNDIDFDTEKYNKNTVEAINLTHTAIFKKDKLIGYLDNQQSISLNFILGEFKQGLIRIPGLVDKEKYINFEIKRSKSKMKAQIIDGNIFYTIEITGEGLIREIQDSTDITDVNTLYEVQDQINKNIKNNIENLIKTIQKDYNSDIFGFGVELYKKYPKQWKEIENDWDKYFPHVKCQAIVNFKVRRSNQIIPPLGVKPAPVQERY